MEKKSVCTLQYINSVEDSQGYAEDVIEEIKIKCDILERFSAQYYDNLTRNMRESMNFRILSKYLTKNLVNVVYKGVVYSIKKELADREYGENYTILDCQESKICN